LVIHQLWHCFCVFIFAHKIIISYILQKKYYSNSHSKKIITYCKLGICGIVMHFLYACKSSNNISSSKHKHDATSQKASKSTAKASQTIENILNQAQSMLGVPYKYGGSSAQGFDCSGLVYFLSNKNGINMPRISSEQAALGKLVEKSELQKGDLVFFDTAKNNGNINHVGIVIAVLAPTQVKFIHASTSKGVVEDNLFAEYWKKTFVKAKRPFVF
jgi:probable lipoprotein NlpC